MWICSVCIRYIHMHTCARFMWEMHQICSCGNNSPGEGNITLRWKTYLHCWSFFFLCSLLMLLFTFQIIASGGSAARALPSLLYRCFFFASRWCRKALSNKQSTAGSRHAFWGISWKGCVCTEIDGNCRKHLRLMCIWRGLQTIRYTVIIRRFCCKRKRQRLNLYFFFL